MSRTGYSKQQQNQLKRLVFECSIARLSSTEIQQISKEKLDIPVTDNWIRRIRKRLRDESEAEFKHLLMDNFAFKHQYMQRIKEFEEIQRLQWEIARKPHLTNEDIMRLKCLSEIRESTILVAEAYNALPGIDSFTPNHQEEAEEEHFIVHKEAKVYDSKARASNAGLATFTRYKDAFGQEREVAEHPDYKGGPIHPDYKGRYPWDEGYEGNAKF